MLAKLRKPTHRPDPPDRARTMAQAITATLDRIAGLDEALPELRVLAQGLATRGLSALNDRPLPSLAQLQETLHRLAPHESPAMRDARAMLISCLDRRRLRRLPSVGLTGVEAQEVSMDEFIDVFGLPAQPALAGTPAGTAEATSPAPATAEPAKGAAAAAQAPTATGPWPEPGAPPMSVQEASLDDFNAALAAQTRA
jgi:hypothetical protein